VLTHVGRSSGKTYRTPLDAHSVAGGYIFIIMYGADSDWVQNVLASGTATVAVDGEQFDLESPKVISKQEAFKLLSETTKAPAEFLKVTEYIQLDVRT
jgi:deazaflavin-dependent oxidoreductase (nitroreductase family)